jgi:hypothetical protein
VCLSKVIRDAKNESPGTPTNLGQPTEYLPTVFACPATQTAGLKLELSSAAGCEWRLQIDGYPPWCAGKKAVSYQPRLGLAIGLQLPFCSAISTRHPGFVRGKPIREKLAAQSGAEFNIRTNPYLSLQVPHG